MKKKWWIAFGESAIFSPRDVLICVSVPRDGNKEQNLSKQSYVEADDYESSRIALKAKVDEYFDHMKHMDMLEQIGRQPKAPPPPPITQDGGSLRIGDPSERKRIPGTGE